MRKLVLVLAVLVVFQFAVSAQGVGVGIVGAAFFKSPYLLGQPIDVSAVNVNQFVFGGDLRLKVSIFQAEALVLLAMGDLSSFNIYLDAGFALDIAILRLSIGAGPNFTFNVGDSAPLQAGLNAKLGADLKFGPISLGISYIMALSIDNGIHPTTASGLLGAQILYWIEPAAKKAS